MKKLKEEIIMKKFICILAAIFIMTGLCSKQ